MTTPEIIDKIQGITLSRQRGRFRGLVGSVDGFCTKNCIKKKIGKLDVAFVSVEKKRNRVVYLDLILRFFVGIMRTRDTPLYPTVEQYISIVYFNY